MKLLNYDNNETYDCYINDDKGYELNLNECGYEKCSPSHYWDGMKKFWLVHYVLSGKGVLSVNGGESYPVKAGQIFFISPYDRIYYEADEEDPWEYIWIGFSGLSAKSIFQRSSLLKEPVQDVRNEKMLLDLYKSIASDSRKGDVAYLLVLSGLYRFIAYLLENYGIDKAAQTFNVKEQNFRKIVKMLDSKYKTAISVEKIAQLVGYEKTYVYRLFQEFLGLSPLKYVNYLRVIEAIQRIKLAENKSFEVLASELGFNDYSNFFRTFKSFVGISPNEYRERVKNNTTENLKLKSIDEVEAKIDKFRG